MELVEQASVSLGTSHGEFKLSAFARNKDEVMPHLALASNEITNSIPNVRIHSECITGDLFGSCRCDCGAQLQKSLEYISKNGGVLIYLRQEGRGIGIINKIKAYNEQDKGCDTAEANKKLGFDYDARSYEDAVSILKQLDIHKINLLTNNPEKLKAFENEGIEVVKRIALEIPPNNSNSDYLKTKKEFFGHFLEMV